MTVVNTEHEGQSETLPRNILISAFVHSKENRSYTALTPPNLHGCSATQKSILGVFTQILQCSQLNQGAPGMFTHPKMNPRTVSHLQDPARQLH